MDKQISLLDEKIRLGQGGAVRMELKALQKKPARELLADYAWIAWRAGIPELGVKLLNPIVRSKPRSPVVASAREKAEYASCLVRIGAVDEALAILDTVTACQVPRSPLYRVFGLVSQWRYSETLEPLQSFLKNATGYDALVAGVNLAAAYVVLRRDDEAFRQLDNLEIETEKAGSVLLLGNVRELKAAAHIRMRRWSEALKTCQAASAALKDHGSVFALLLDKWATLARMGLSQKPAPSQLLDIKRRAHVLGHWETIRDCDRFESILTGNAELFLKLYFGTPYPEFRESLKLESSLPAAIPAKFAWKIPPAAAQSKNVVDLTAPIDGVKPGQQNHRALSILASDFYRPFRTAQLHALLFGEEFYNPLSSPHRVAEAVHRLKGWVQEAIPGLSVESTDAGYSLVAHAPVTLHVPVEKVGAGDSEIQILKRAFRDETFSTSQAESKLGYSRRTLTRLLQEWVSDGRLKKIGAGRATRYSLKK